MSGCVAAFLSWAVNYGKQTGANQVLPMKDTDLQRSTLAVDGEFNCSALMAEGPGMPC